MLPVFMEIAACRNFLFDARFARKTFSIVWAALGAAFLIAEKLCAADCGISERCMDSFGQVCRYFARIPLKILGFSCFFQ